MNKNLKTSYILLFVFSGILLAWPTLTNFFSGVGINFVAIVGITFAISALCFLDKTTFKRIKDMLFCSCGFCLLELIIYFACEYGHGETFEGFIVYQNIISFLGLLFLAYICFRFITEIKNIRIGFIEIMLGNQQRVKKEKKKSKEISNGSLEEKPINQNQEDIKNEEETTVIIETEE